MDLSRHSSKVRRCFLAGVCAEAFFVGLGAPGRFRGRFDAVDRATLDCAQGLRHHAAGRGTGRREQLRMNSLILLPGHRGRTADARRAIVRFGRWISRRHTVATGRQCAGDRAANGHDVARDRLENTPGSDVFGHNRKRRFGHENTGCHFTSGAAHDYRGGLHRPASDQRPTDRAKGELSGLL